MENSSEAKTSKRDIGWKYNYLQNPKDSNVVTCNFCGFVSRGGIHRAKQHQVGKFKNAKSCPSCPPEVKEELQNQLNSIKVGKSEAIGSNSSFTPDIYELEVGDDINMEVDDDVSYSQLKRSVESSDEVVQKKMKGKIPQHKGPMDLFVMGKGKKRQQSIVDACDKEARNRTIQAIARWFYQAGIPFNAAKLPSFEKMVEAVGRYGPNLKPPSYHEMRVTLLNREVAYTKELMKDHVESWSQYGCSIMSDSWTDRKSRCLINFLVNSAKGTMFIKSIDASTYSKTGEKLFELLDSFVEEIGEQNVLQVITDNGSNYVLAGKLLQAKRKQLYWTPCAAHCIDLMLEDIGKIPHMKRTIEHAIFLVGFIYNHGSVLSTMRSFTEKKELLRFGVTRFATTFLTLQRLHILKNKLRRMFRSQDWEDNKLCKTVKGKRAYGIVLRQTFWNSVLYALKVMGPLVTVLRLVDNEKKPAMGYIYEAMDRAKETIQKSFHGNEEKYESIFKIIDDRWNCQLHHPLHAAGHFLNPTYFEKNSAILSDSEVTSGLFACIEKLAPNIELQDKIIGEISFYKRAEGKFSTPLVTRSRNIRSPAEWWSLFGSDTPNLQRLAVRILSLTCSASGCERNWSTFEHIHTKKRNRLEHRKLLDLVYVKYNQKLKARYNVRDAIDPLSLDSIDFCNEWMVGEMDDEQHAGDELVFENDTLTWRDVERASGVSEPVRNTRQHASSSHSRMLLEDDVDSDAEEEIEGDIEDNLLEENLDLVDDDEDHESDLDY